ncbi:MAG: acyl CoA:acetate/3-ketoacid CoA transferase [Vulcanimicrobiaceae bacterium]
MKKPPPSPQSFYLRKKSKVVTAKDAVRLIRDGDTVATGGFVGSSVPEGLLAALESHFLESGKPRNLTLFYAAGQGDGGARGLNHLAHEGLVSRVIGGHWGLVPKIGQLVLEGRAQWYNFPLGVLAHLLRDIAAHKPGTLTQVGLGTFVDPRFGGGKINRITTEDLVEIVNLHGCEYLFYKALPINVAFLRGTTADADGNVTMEKEAVLLDGLAIATAAYNSGGIVIVQVERLAEAGTLDPKDVKIPGLLVDCVVVSQASDHWQTFAESYSASFSGELRMPVGSIAPLPLDKRKVIARRAALELRPNSVVNLGIGLPEGVASVANEEKLLELLTLTTEAGTIGGLPAAGLSFGASYNSQAVIDMPAQFDFYDGGGLDVAFLGLAQADGEGNVNVSKYGGKLSGAGGFINITQSAKSLVFLGTFTAGKMDVSVENGKLNIVREGTPRKFVDEVEERTFSGPLAAAKGQSVLFVTERCVLRLSKDGLELVEIAPGVDLERDILDQMDFRPLMKQSPRLMDARIFRTDPMNLRDDLLRIPLADRLWYDPRRNLFFINFEGLEISSNEDVDEMSRMVESRLGHLNAKVRAVVNYDNFIVPLGLVDYNLAALKRIWERYYADATRYTSTAFHRMKNDEAAELR